MKIFSFRARGLICAASFLILSSFPAFSLDIKIFPPEATVSLNDTVLKPTRVATYVRSYVVPNGEISLVIAAPGYDSRTVVVPAKRPKLMEEKLEPTDGRLKLVSILPSGVQPKSVTFSPDGKYVSVPNLADNGIDIYTVEPFALFKKIAPPKNAKQQGFVESLFVPSRNELWISQMFTGMVHVFDSRDFSYKETFKTGGEYPKVVTISADTKIALVSNWVSGNVSIIDVASRKLIKLVKTNGTPRGLAFSEDGKSFYVCIYEGGRIDQYNLADYKRINSWFFGADAAMRHIILRNGKIYVSDMHGAVVYILDPVTGKRLHETVVGSCPNTIALSPDGKYLYVSTRGKNGDDYTKKGPDFGRVLMLDAQDGHIISWVWGKNQPTGLDVSPDGGTLIFSDFLDAEIELYHVVQ